MYSAKSHTKAQLRYENLNPTKKRLDAFLGYYFHFEVEPPPFGQVTVPLFGWLRYECHVFHVLTGQSRVWSGNFSNS